MAYPTAVNSQITDAVSQSKVATVASATTMAIRTLFQTIAHGQALMTANAANRQQNAQTVAEASMNASIRSLWANDQRD